MLFNFGPLDLGYEIFLSIIRIFSVPVKKENNLNFLNYTVKKKLYRYNLNFVKLMATFSLGFLG
jgi:hypothetical protein